MVFFFKSDAKNTTNFIIDLTDMSPVRTQFVTIPKLVLGSYVKGPNNKICREWTERLGLNHRTVVGHGFHGGRTELNIVYLIRFFPSVA